MLYGIDISHYNDGLAQKVLATEKADFCMIKASEGKGWRDDCAKNYAKLCISENIPVFFYHYCRPDINKTPEQEVNNFLLTVIDIMKDDWETPVGLAIDWEQESIGHEIWLESFVKVLRDNTGSMPLLYCSQSVVKKAGFFLNTDRVHLWVAHWGRESGKPGAVDPWKKWVFHQYTISGGIDRNVFNGDATEIKRYTDYWIPRYLEDADPGDGKHCCCCSCGDECNQAGN